MPPEMPFCTSVVSGLMAPPVPARHDVGVVGGRARAGTVNRGGIHQRDQPGASQIRGRHLGDIN